MSRRDKAELLRAIEAHFRSGIKPGTPEETARRWLAFELASVDIHRKNLVPFVRGHGAKRGDRVLDFGSGPGCSACAMALELGVFVIGVEPNETNRIVAPLWLEYCGVEDQVELHFLENTRELPLAGESVDFVLASSVLEYIPGDRGLYLREMWRVLKPGGRLLIAGTSNAAWPREVHSKTWLVNWMPNLGPRIRARLGRSHDAERGVTFGELEAALPGARFVRGQVDQLEAFAERAAARLPLAKDTATDVLTNALHLIDSRTSRAVGWPLEAFLPWLNVAFEKPGRGSSR
jgi:ubiquinone/menaquinone biosynthesis C-methylase UbiE